MFRDVFCQDRLIVLPSLCTIRFPNRFFPSCFCLCRSPLILFHPLVCKVKSASFNFFALSSVLSYCIFMFVNYSFCVIWLTNRFAQTYIIHSGKVWFIWCFASSSYCSFPHKQVTNLLIKYFAFSSIYHTSYVLLVVYMVKDDASFGGLLICVCVCLWDAIIYWTFMVLPVVFFFCSFASTHLTYSTLYVKSRWIDLFFLLPVCYLTLFEWNSLQIWILTPTPISTQSHNHSNGHASDRKCFRHISRWIIYDVWDDTWFGNQQGSIRMVRISLMLLLFASFAWHTYVNALVCYVLWLLQWISANSDYFSVVFLALSLRLFVPFCSIFSLLILQHELIHTYFREFLGFTIPSNDVWFAFFFSLFLLLSTHIHCRYACIISLFSFRCLNFMCELFLIFGYRAVGLC